MIVLFFLIASVFAEEPAYITRGHETEKVFETYTKRFDALYASILKSLKAEAPELVVGFTEKPAPDTVPSGYGRLPKIIVKETAAPNLESASVPYSWPITLDLLRRENDRLDEEEQKLKVLSKMTGEERKNVLKGIIQDYDGLKSNEAILHHHIQHNWFWQKEIFGDRERFNRLNVLHDVAARLGDLRHKENTAGTNDVLKSEIAELTQKLSEETIGKAHLPTFAKVTAKSGKTKIVIPVYSDIADKAFLARFKKIVEKFWKSDSLSVEVDVRPIALKMLYMGKGAESTKLPKPGDAIDVDKHASLFPKDGAALTTGALATHSLPHRYIALGPQEISENVLAHEFGHILGFIDGYFRGYRDLKKDGFEIHEIIPNPEDIMNNPESGRVMKQHFEVLLKK